MINTIQKMFLGNSPSWYKSTIVVFLIINPIALIVLNSLNYNGEFIVCLLYTSPSPRDAHESRMPSSA